jgi:hypothetical protein
VFLGWFVHACCSNCLFSRPVSRCQGKRKEISLSEFTLGLKAIGFSASDEAAKSLFDKLDVNGDGIINYLEWNDYLAVDDLYGRVYRSLD